MEINEPEVHIGDNVLLEAFRLGVDAHGQGRPVNMNPYAPTALRMWHQWQLGWQYASYTAEMQQVFKREHPEQFLTLEPLHTVECYKIVYYAEFGLLDYGGHWMRTMETTPFATEQLANDFILNHPKIVRDSTGVIRPISPDTTFRIRRGMEHLRTETI